MHWRHKGSHLHNNDASLVSRSAHVLCWQCALALSLSVRGPAQRCGLQGLPPWLHAWRWRTWQCFVWPPTQLGALLWRHMHMVYDHSILTPSLPFIVILRKFEVVLMSGVRMSTAWKKKKKIQYTNTGFE